MSGEGEEEEETGKNATMRAISYSNEPTWWLQTIITS